ncbi:Glycine cleavage system transcriptional activator [wastewater metagenome]|uniref:Glycine cleavage system transcriptional activator n=2 Tax=unclassified sequences TaxID=12908 RepID=A0A5B8RHH7_9ZZZZ|nr:MULTISPECIES: LysR substrate-binding domain-containing protein [Arhodomonas]MCS4504466.1 LysR substrate-binding domain-containing protein [Arhodomonas aquaeolei]QEA06157.1 glycine cleavage system transcriptional activator [uncultured organism]
MIERLPLNALRAFVVAARHESFQQAAAELHVTAGAVSRQVKELESRLAFPVFERNAHGVRLNAAGRRLAESAGAGLDRLAEAYREAQRLPRAGLSISAPPSFVQHWLLPRLAGFDARGEEVALEASEVLTQPEWDDGRARLAIRYGTGPWPGVEDRPLLSDPMFPVCSPALLERGPPLQEPADLAGHTLIHVSCTEPAIPTWRHWLDHVGAAGVPAPVQWHYSLFSHALDQAIAGRGVALVGRVVAADRLDSGVLVRPFGERYAFPSPFGYSLITPAAGEPPPLAVRFIDWLMGEVARFREGHPGD